ncbi:hypothetical protein M501DRAFT_994994 [Patellaria atrata CBS 101060]|uniref:Uncharacterized protein n=1 Tax=Patellaria atrata CBS 101060 TaxID=1346257 RepID=A0A9P4VNI4_9PEZI|nr:hypothetical protein M501DRAFT_994994 [Patellaria atrata CBS 101060]
MDALCFSFFFGFVLRHTLLATNLPYQIIFNTLHSETQSILHTTHPTSSTLTFDFNLNSLNPPTNKNLMRGAYQPLNTPSKPQTSQASSSSSSTSTMTSQNTQTAQTTIISPTSSTTSTPSSSRVSSRAPSPTRIPTSRPISPLSLTSPMTLDYHENNYSRPEVCGRSICWGVPRGARAGWS